jgi:hypothetical protein
VPIDVLMDAGRLVRLWLDAALVRARAGLVRAHAAGTVARERVIREQLAALWPVTLVTVTLHAPHLPAGPDHGPLDVYAGDETASIAFGVILQSNYAGIRPLTGSLSVAVIGPPIGASPRTNGTPDVTLDLPAPNFVDRVALEGTWAPDEGFDAGVWRFDFLWDGRKIGEREFVVSA